MSYNLSGCVFIRNTFKGAFCLFESMYQLLPLCDEFIVMDLGSDDGTLEVLKEIEAANSKVKVVQSTFYKQDAGIFADLANDLVAMCNCPNVLYYQSDEIWHEDLIKSTIKDLDFYLNYCQIEEINLSFWRYQLKYNFQEIKWFPHPVHRIGPKSNFNFTNDGMNTNKVFDTKMVCSEDAFRRRRYDLDMFTQWGDKYKFNSWELPTNEMILDVSLTGGFLDNVPDRRRMHLPFWGEGDVMPTDEGEVLSVDSWYNLHSSRPEWTKRDTKFNIPEIMKYHLGKRKYELRPQLLEALKSEAGWRY